MPTYYWYESPTAATGSTTISTTITTEIYEPTGWTSTTTRAHIYTAPATACTTTWTCDDTAERYLRFQRHVDGWLETGQRPAPQHTVPTESQVREAQETERRLQELHDRQQRLFAKDLAEQRRANRRALAILLRTLSAPQRAEFRQHHAFHVVGGASGTRYRIRKGRMGNVDVYCHGKVAHRLCCHPALSVPDYDTMLTQLLWLQGDGEQEFLRTANVHRLRDAALDEVLQAAEAQSAVAAEFARAA